MKRPAPPAAPPRPLDKAQAAALRERLRGLRPDQAETLRRVMRLHAEGDRLMATQWLLQLAGEAPDHPEVLRWQALRHLEEGDAPAAVADLTRATAARPQDAGLWIELGTAQGRADDLAGAGASFARALQQLRTADEALRLSLAADGQGLFDVAAEATERSLQMQPRQPVALLQRARCHKALGHPEAAAADCRALIALGQETARAWFALTDLKTVALTPAELDALARETERAERQGQSAEACTLLDFALGKALEDVGQLDAALAVFSRANARVAARLPWNVAAFGSHVESVRRAFDPGPAAAAPAGQGGEVIFLVGLPRSGSTLVEQVLASHSAVEGASELPDLGQVIAAESRRCGQPFPGWVAQAEAADWARLGQDYLQRTARWRRQRPISTDKLPDNWLYVGAVRAMLPGARVIECRRDPAETAWSCFKQLFGPGLAPYSYGFDRLAAYTAQAQRLGDFWAQRDPERVRVQAYEALVAEPEAQVRALLDFCGLAFEPGCLRAHEAERAIRTPSALQVRQPMRAVSSPAARYGDRLDALRAALREALAAARPDDRAPA